MVSLIVGIVFVLIAVALFIFVGVRKTPDSLRGYYIGIFIAGFIVLIIGIATLVTINLI